MGMFGCEWLSTPDKAVIQENEAPHILEPSRTLTLLSRLLAETRCE
jgi:hypothetical protein